MSGQTFRANNGDFDAFLGAPPSYESKAFSGPHLTTIPIEPSETLELSVHSRVPEQLYGDENSSIGEKNSSTGTRDETAARVKALGIEGPLFKSFACVIPGHDHQARVHPTTAGFWQYHCEGLRRDIGFGEVRGFMAYGCERWEMSNLEAVRWRERLDYEAQLRQPVPLDVRLPEPCPEAARIVAGKMRVFVGLRDRRFPSNEPFVFALDFAQAYCGLTPDQVRAGKDLLERAGVIYRVGKNGRSILWKLTAQDANAAGNENRGRS